MKILFVVPYPLGTAPGQRFRFEYFFPLFKKEGINFKVHAFVSPRLYKILYKHGHIMEKIFYVCKGFIFRLWTILSASGYDVIYIFREAFPFGPPFFEKILSTFGKPMIFDFDDAIYLPSISKVNKYVSFFKNASKTSRIINMSSCVLAGNKNLAEYASRYNNNVIIFPTVIDTVNYTVKNDYFAKAAICVGWTGSYSTIEHLNLLIGVLKKIYDKYRVKIKIVGSAEFSIDGVNVDAKEWSALTEIDDLKQMDIGIMPLPDDEWSRGKCGLKALQYMALGIPAVCSPVGVNSDIIEDGVNGFLAASEKEWVDKLSLLIENPQLRRSLGQNGRITVESRYSVEAQAPVFLEVIASFKKKEISNVSHI